MSSAPIRRWRLGNRLFSKPAGRAQAADQLRLLAGGTHELHSAVAVARDGKIVFSDVSVARMTMRRLSESEIEAYLDQAGEAVTTSVGAYQLEGLGVHLFERIEGDHFTILGLPLLPLLAFLRRERLLECLRSSRNGDHANADTWTDRLDRDGKIHHRKAVRGGGRAGLRRRCRRSQNL